MALCANCWLLRGVIVVKFSLVWDLHTSGIDFYFLSADGLLHESVLYRRNKKSWPGVRSHIHFVLTENPVRDTILIPIFSLHYIS